MSKSLTYHLTMRVLRMKGIKKIFSQAPLDYQKLRREDVRKPKKRNFKNATLRSFSILETHITEIKPATPSQKLLIFIHGGAFISGPAQHHWDSLKQIIKKKPDITVWMCDYPKAPEHQITEISANMDAVYQMALDNYDSGQITLVGDSVGGTLITALTQRLIANQSALPASIILICPVMDASLTNPDVAEVEPKDPMLSTNGILSAKTMCAGKESLTSPIISPLYGNFEGFPPTVLYLATHDIMYPDGLLAAQKLKEAEVRLQVVQGEDMPHIWPLLPVMAEAKEALNHLIDQL